MTETRDGEDADTRHLKFPISLQFVLSVELVMPFRRLLELAENTTALASRAIRCCFYLQAMGR